MKFKGSARGQMHWSAGSSATAVSARSPTQVSEETEVKFQVELNTWQDHRSVSVHLTDLSFLGCLYLDM